MLFVMHLSHTGCCIGKHKKPGNGDILNVTQKETIEATTEKVGYFRRVGRYFKNLFTWSSDDDDEDDHDNSKHDN